MKAKMWIAIVIVALGAVGIGYEIWKNSSPSFPSNYNTSDTLKVETNSWIPYLSIPEGDTDFVYEVTWDQKYGATKKAYCMAIFKDDKLRQYGLIAPWISSIVIENQNTNNVKITKVLKKDVPNYKNYK